MELEITLSKDGNNTHSRALECRVWTQGNYRSTMILSHDHLLSASLRINLTANLTHH